MKLTIDRGRWLRGDSDSMLLNCHGNMCCVGFYCRALGVPDGLLLNVGPASDAQDGEGLHPLIPAWLTSKETHEEQDEDTGEVTGEYESFYDSVDAADLYEANDSTSLTESDRETRIAAIFASHGVEVEFTG